MKLGLVLVLMLQVSSVGANTSTRLTEQERAALFAIQEEVTDFALEVRTDVCIGFDTRSNIRSGRVLDALREKGLKFHDSSWCNHCPRGVTILIETPQGAQTTLGSYEFVASVNDFDPIRLYGDHFGALLRKSKYVIHCVTGSEPVLVSYQLVCCEKGTRKAETAH